MKSMWEHISSVCNLDDLLQSTCVSPFCKAAHFFLPLPLAQRPTRTLRGLSKCRAHQVYFFFPRILSLFSSTIPPSAIFSTVNRQKNRGRRRRKNGSKLPSFFFFHSCNNPFLIPNSFVPAFSVCLCALQIDFVLFASS